MSIKAAASGFLLLLSAFGQSPHPAVGPGAYDVVSIKLEVSDPGSNGFRYTPTGFEAYGVTLADIVKEAYGLPDLRLVKGASVLKPAYHIVAKFSEPDMAAMQSLAPAQVTQVRQRLLRVILKDRFRVTVHHTTAQLPIYSLKIGKSGFKLQQVAPEPGNAPQEKKEAFFAPGRIKGVFSMEQLARILSLSRKVGSDASERRVFDNTGLRGRYVFDLAWADTSGQPPPDSKGIEVYGSAISALEQVGLQLVPKTIAADSIVIDRAAAPTLD